MSHSSKPSRRNPASAESFPSFSPSNPSFEVLRFSRTSPTNAISFMRTAYTYAVQQVGLVAQIILTSQHYVVPAPVIPPSVNGVSPFHPDNDALGLAKAEYQIRLKVCYLQQC